MLVSGRLLGPEVGAEKRWSRPICWVGHCALLNTVLTFPGYIPGSKQTPQRPKAPVSRGPCLFAQIFILRALTYCGSIPKLPLRAPPLVVPGHFLTLLPHDFVNPWHLSQNPLNFHEIGGSTPLPSSPPILTTEQIVPVEEFE